MPDDIISPNMNNDSNARNILQNINGANGDNNNISAAAVKLPTFWTPCPEAWFIQAEIQFRSKGIRSDDTMFEYVVQALPLDVIMNILDFLQSPPTQDKYETIKRVLIHRFSESEEKKLEQLLCNSEMGDRRPSEFYRSMEILAGTSSTFGKELIKKLWMRKLPSSINIALISSGKQDIKDLLELADKIQDVSKINYISALSSYNSNNNIYQNPNNSEISLLTNKISKLEDKMNHLEDLIRNLSINRNYPRQFSRSRSRNRIKSNDQPKQFCWYHFKFGHKASKCISPCSFSKSSDNQKN